MKKIFAATFAIALVFSMQANNKLELTLLPSFEFHNTPVKNTIEGFQFTNLSTAIQILDIDHFVNSGKPVTNCFLIWDHIKMFPSTGYRHAWKLGSFAENSYRKKLKQITAKGTPQGLIVIIPGMVSRTLTVDMVKLFTNLAYETGIDRMIFLTELKAIQSFKRAKVEVDGNFECIIVTSLTDSKSLEHQLSKKKTIASKLPEGFQFGLDTRELKQVDSDLLHSMLDQEEEIFIYFDQSTDSIQHLASLLDNYGKKPNSDKAVEEKLLPRSASQ
ncbi:MAG: hypothetical protein MI748_13685 [Opitutales bacterium]|nr:hypothetical protein [Opitutales bacterium]